MMLWLGRAFGFREAPKHSDVLSRLWWRCCYHHARKWYPGDCVCGCIADHRTGSEWRFESRERYTEVCPDARIPLRVFSRQHGYCTVEHALKPEQVGAVASVTRLEVPLPSGLQRNRERTGVLSPGKRFRREVSSSSSSSSLPPQSTVASAGPASAHSASATSTSAWWTAPGPTYYDGRHTHADEVLLGTVLDSDRSGLRNTVRAFAHEYIAPYAAAIDEANRFPREQLWTELGNLGVLGVATANAYGGLGLGLVEHCLVMEELSRASPSIGLSYGAHSNLCMMQIERHGSAAQKERLLPPLCSGVWVGALAMSETGAGSDVLGSMRTSAYQRKRTTAAGELRSGWSIRGTKMWITNGPDADVVVVYARTPELESHSASTSTLAAVESASSSSLPKQSKPKLTAFVLETAQLGPRYRVAQKLDKLGMRGSNTCELVFDDVWVPDDAVLGEPGLGTTVLMAGLDAERLVLSAGPLGIMQACLDVVLPYVRERQQFGSPIGTFPLMQAKLADMYGALAASRAHTFGVAASVDKLTRQIGEPTPPASSKHGGLNPQLRRFRKDCASVILQNAERATQCALQAIQALGGNGYISDYPTGRLLRDAKLYEIGAGTSEIRRILIGRELYEASHATK